MKSKGTVKSETLRFELHSSQYGAWHWVLCNGSANVVTCSSPTYVSEASAVKSMKIMASRLGLPIDWENKKINNHIVKVYEE